MIDLTTAKQRIFEDGDCKMRLDWQPIGYGGGVWYLRLNKDEKTLVFTNEIHPRRQVIFDLWDVLKAGIIAQSPAAKIGAARLERGWL